MAHIKETLEQSPITSASYVKKVFCKSVIDKIQQKCDDYTLISKLFIISARTTDRTTPELGLIFLRMIKVKFW